MQPVTLYVNGDERKLVVDPLDTLLTVLRDRLGLKGTKEGCGTGYCGACTVHVGGEPVNACLFFAVDADHREVTTIEGLAADDMHPLQRTFVEHGALQCGYCTPGMLMAASALLRDNAAPSEERIRSALSGNLCRCTGYQSIVRAVQAAADAVHESDRARATPAKPAARVRSRA